MSDKTRQGRLSMSEHIKTTLTTIAGCPIAENQNSFTEGPREPILLQDVHLLEKLAHQNRKRIPEKTVQAKEWRAHGKLTVTQDITKYTKAKLFSELGKQKDLIIRISNVTGELGAADAERDVRDFAINLYTEEGNWDIAENNTPVFFVKAPLKFPDFIHTQKRHPKTNLRSKTAMWDFWSLSPESLYQVTILFSDRGIHKGVKNMNSHGSHTYSFFNKENERFWVKFHFKTMQEHAHWTDAEASEIIEKTRESFQENLFSSIEKENYPKWKFYIQIMPEIEQLALSPSNNIPGVEFSPDKMLQAKLFAYADAHRHRIETHYEALPVNSPKCPVHNYHKDGAMRFFSNCPHPDAYYEPNSFNEPKEVKLTLNMEKVYIRLF